jgi:hypothetical protein
MGITDNGQDEKKNIYWNDSERILLCNYIFLQPRPNHQFSRSAGRLLDIPPSSLPSHQAQVFQSTHHSPK